MSAAPGSGSGTGYSRISNGFPAPWNTAILAVSAIASSFGKAAGHHVTIWNDHTKDVTMLAARLKDTEALALIRERTPIRAPLLERLGKLRLISQTGVYPHLDVEACTRRGVIVSSYMAPG